MDQDTSFATTVLSPTRLKALDELLASMEVSLTLLRYAPGDGRGAMPWSPEHSPGFCRQVAAGLDLHGNEIEEGEFEDLDTEAVRTMLLHEAELLTALDAQCLRLRRVLALSEEVLDAVGSDAMAWAMDMYVALERAGCASRIKPWWRHRDA